MAWWGVSVCVLVLAVSAYVAFELVGCVLLAQFVRRVLAALELRTPVFLFEYVAGAVGVPRGVCVAVYVVLGVGACVLV